MNETKVIEGSPLLAGPGLISIQDFCETFQVEPAMVLGEILNHKILIACRLNSHPIYWVDDYTVVDRQEDSDGFVLDSAFELGIPQTFTGHLRPFHRSHTIANIIEYGYSDETAFRFKLNTRTAAFCDLPGIRLTNSSVFITKIQAERIRAPWVKALVGKSALLAATAAPPAVISAASAPTTLSYECCRPSRAKELVSSLMDQFLTRKQIKWKPDQQKRMATQCGAFVALMNDPQLGALNRQLIWDYETKLRKMPENRYSAARRHKTQDANQLLAMAEEYGETRLSSASVERYMDSLSSMFAWAVDNMILTLNPAKRAIEKSRKNTRNQDDRFLFEKAYLDKIFSAPWFLTGSGERNKQGRFYQFRPHFYWLPLLGLYTGGRINELCQLYIDDIKLSKSGAYYLDFNLDTPDKMDSDVRDGVVTDGSDKTLKTVNSKRIIALHPHVIELGFPAYVKALSKAGHNRLFPELKHDAIKGYGKPAGSWFNERFLGKQLLIPRDGKRTFHSFRHNFITALNEQGVPPDIIAQLAGHSRGPTETAGRYRKDAEADRLLTYITPLNYELPDIKPFSISEGLGAIADALRRKKQNY